MLSERNEDKMIGHLSLRAETGLLVLNSNKARTSSLGEMHEMLQIPRPLCWRG